MTSIYFQLLRLLLLASVISVLTFFALHIAGEYLIENFYYRTGYEQRQDQKYLQLFQQYIEKENLSSEDTDKLDRWVKKQKLLILSVYKESRKVYDSISPEGEGWPEDLRTMNFAEDLFYTVKFSDGEAQVILQGLYTYQVYIFAAISELILAFLLFFAIVLAGIRTRMDDIRKLKEEIEILEGGSLEYEITVKGRDEISALAQGLNNMRLSFRSLIRQEAEMVKENQKIITEMSHDLRTPVTSIMLYTEILRQGKYSDEKERNMYLEKIDQKARYMKHLADGLISHSLTADSTQIELEEPETFESLFYDMLSETGAYLEQCGFQVRFTVSWNDRKLRVCTDYILRIMDNITSNIVKYGDSSELVVITSADREAMAGISFQNRIRDGETKTDSTQIGIQNIRNMMRKMNGKCIVHTGEKMYEIILLFPDAG